MLEKLNFPFNTKLPEPLNKNNVIFTLYGRNALYLGAKSILPKTSKREFLVPCYSCGDEIKTLLNAGFKTAPYKIKPSLQIDFDDIKKRVKKQTVGILVTHYFGFPQKKIDSLRDFCRQKKIFLVEDCAHCMGTKLNDISLGTFGDFSVFSLRKFFPIPHGGALVVNNSSLKPPLPIDPSSRAVVFDLLLFLGFKFGFFRQGISIKEINNRLGYKNYDQHGPRLPQLGGYELGLSKLAKGMLKMIDVKTILEKQRENFQYYLNFFKKNSIQNVKVLFSAIDNDVIPMNFPLIVKNSEEIAKRAREKRVTIGQPFWSFLHPFIKWSQFPEAKELKENIYVIPLSRRLKRSMLNLLLEISSYNNL